MKTMISHHFNLDPQDAMSVCFHTDHTVTIASLYSDENGNSFYVNFTPGQLKTLKQAVYFLETGQEPAKEASNGRS